MSGSGRPPVVEIKAEFFSRDARLLFSYLSLVSCKVTGNTNGNESSKCCGDWLIQRHKKILPLHSTHTDNQKFGALGPFSNHRSSLLFYHGDSFQRLSPSIAPNRR
jgi:hypothetical protein